MIHLALLLLVSSHCASLAMCPSKGQLERAYHLRRDQELWDAMRAENGAHPESITLMTPLRIVRITDVYCGRPDRARDAVSCRFTVVYPTGAAYRIAILKRTADGWEITEAMEVWRDARRAGSEPDRRQPRRSAGAARSGSAQPRPAPTR